MKRICLFLVLLCAVAFPLCAQNWTLQDSLQLQQILNGKGEVKLNPEVLKEIGVETLLGTPKVSLDKSWIDFDTSLPAMPNIPETKIVLTLRPYSSRTKYNWDPIYQKKITVKKDTWRSDPYGELTSRFIYSNWAKTPWDAGPRESVEQIEASGMRYRVTERANNMAVGGWKILKKAPSGMDFMTPFTKSFWDWKGNKRRARTLEVLSTYGDSITVTEKESVRVIAK